MKLFRYLKKGFYSLNEYWKSATVLSSKNRERTRLYFFVDILYCTLRYGANDTDYILFDYYKKNHFNRNQYITWLRTFAINSKLDERGLHELINKPTFNSLFKNYLKRDWIDCSNASVETIENFIKKHRKVIAKPANSALGRGIHTVSFPIEHNEIQKLHYDNFILEELLENVSDIRRLNYNSLNTLRIVTATDSKGNVSVLSAILRMGTGNGITDNLCSGGIACAVDLDTGYLIGPAKNTRGDLFNIHPASQIPFNGFQVPNFKECIDMVLELCHMIPYARYVGWDIAITTRGVCVIEGNMPPSEETTEFSSSGQWQKLNYILSH